MAKTIQYPDGHMIHRTLTQPLPVVAYGKGVYLYTEDGRKILDASGGALVTSVGHGNQEVLNSIAEYTSKISYVSGMQFTSRVAEELADRLAEHAAPIGLTRSAFLSSGSEATEAAVKFARQLCVERKQMERVKIIARVPGYHGNTLFALSASGRPHYKKMYGPLLSPVITIPAPYPYRAPLAEGAYETLGAEHYASLLDEAIRREGPNTVCAFLFEPVIGSSAGASLPPPGYLERVQEICRRHGVITIADEVMVGSGRTGKFFACEHFQFKPDILTLGKGLNGGYAPLSAMMTREESLREIRNGSGYYQHAQTYMHNPAAVAAGLAVLQYMKAHGVLENVQDVGPYFQERLRSKLSHLPGVGSIQGIGLIAGIEFVQDKKTKKPFDRSEKIAEKFTARAFENGITLWPNIGQADGVNGDLVMLGPPLIITETEIDEIVAALEKTIKEVFKSDVHS